MAFKVSIITINRNNSIGLRKTIESVLSQKWKDYEYIIIDGNSTDESLSVIEKFKERISYWVSEKDSGIYNAMNKGIQQSKGEYLLFLNSGDYFANEDILNNIFSNPVNENIIYGNYIAEDTGVSYKSPRELRFSTFWYKSICHQSAFIAKSLFDKHGLYDESLKIASDWHFFIKALFLGGATSKWIDLDFVIIDNNGLSSQPEVYKITQKERKLVYERYFKGFIEDYEELLRYKMTDNIWIYKIAKRVHKLYRAVKKMIYPQKSN
jgi:glycosyltransferase involved in cell wall biosynthesis